MIRHLLYIFSSVLLVYSCGTTKETTQDAKTISAKDYPYITKFHNGVRMKAKGRLDEARKSFEECLLIRQDDDAVYFALSQIELISDNLDKSAEYIQKAASIDPNNTWYIQELAYMHYERGDYAKSVENFKKLVAIEPRNVDWLYGYAEALVKSGQPAKAIEALNKTEYQLGKHPELSLQKYSLYMSLNQKDKALDELKKVLVEFPQDPQIIATMVDHYFKNNQQELAVDMLEKLVKADPGNGRARLALADVYRQQGKQKLAYEHLKKAFESVDLDLDTKMMILLRIHESSFKIDPEVFELVAILVARYPNEAKVYSIQGDYLLRAEKESEALVAYRNALKFDKSQYPIWNQVLIMEYQQGNYEDLYTDSKECLTLFPTISTVYLLHGVSANQMKRHDEALETLSIGIELILNDLSLTAEYEGQLGEAYFGLKDVSNGKKHYDKALELDPKSTLLKNNYAYRLASSKIDLNKAEMIVIQAIKGSPKQAQFHDTYGWVLFQKGEYKNALEQFERASTFDASDAVIIEHIGDAAIMLDRTEKAIEMWEKAKALHSTSKTIDLKIQHKKYYEPNN